MIDYKETSINNFIFHRISIDNKQSLLSAYEYDFANIEDEETLKKIFLKPFVGNTSTFEFKHEIDIELNVLYKLSKSVYEENDFLSKSKDIHQHLQSVSKHPNIKDGDLFIVKYNDIQLNNEFYEGLGIYKIENKENFIETISTETGENGLIFKKGIGARRLDKACLIIFTEEPYTLLIIDNVSSETDYWKNEFINVCLKNDHINNTNQFLTLTKSYITEQFPNEYETNKADQIDLLNRSVAYFKGNELFDKEQFQKEVFKDNEVIESFRNFDKTYSQNNELDLSDNFEISALAVKKQARVFKSVLKLDKNFHIYIHGDRELIEQGREQDGRKYYKIYYQTEH